MRNLLVCIYTSSWLNTAQEDFCFLDESLVSLWIQSTENCPHKLFSLIVGRTSDKRQHLEWPTPSGWWWLTATCLSSACKKKKKSTISSCSLYFDVRLFYQVKTKRQIIFFYCTLSNFMRIWFLNVHFCIIPIYRSSGYFTKTLKATQQTDCGKTYRRDMERRIFLLRLRFSPVLTNYKMNIKQCRLNVRHYRVSEYFCYAKVEIYHTTWASKNHCVT